jgi:hypothetical protein
MSSNGEIKISLSEMTFSASVQVSKIIGEKNGGEEMGNGHSRA